MYIDEENRMARILLSWELGGGLGHINRLCTIARFLKKKNHNVALVLRELSQAAYYCEKDDIPCFHAPLFQRNKRISFPISTYAQLLYHCGFDNDDALTARIKAWKNIIRLYKPDILIADHSPTALCAFHSMPVKKILVGTGFSIPPAISPLPEMRKPGFIPEEEVIQWEERVVTIIGKAFKKCRIDPIKHLFQIYEADAKLLFTFPECDHFSQRKDGEYVGICPPPTTGISLKWPLAEGKRIFGYLTHYRGIDTLLDVLIQTPCSYVLFIRNMEEKLYKTYHRANLVLSKKPLNIHRAVAACDLGICHATHDTSLRLLLAGKPLFMLPLFLEQGMTADNIQHSGAGLSVPFFSEKKIRYSMNRMLGEPYFKTSAEAFSRKYRDNDSQKALTRLISIIEN
jgi:spore coat polysaccharide biosynthesis predicted glycosyltransferase SpsG